MIFCPFNLKHRTFIVFASAMVVQSVGAQQTIIFSKPAGDVTEKANSFMPAPTQLRGGAGAFNAPSSVFGGLQPAGSFDVLPGLRAPVNISPEEAKHWQKILETKKKWTLMTPEEILGVSTAEQILGIPDPKNDEKLSPEDRFLRRQNHEIPSPATNSRPNAALFRPDSPDNPFRPQTEKDRPFNDRSSNQGDRVEPGSTKYFNQFLQAVPNLPLGSETKAESAWSNPFDRPAPAAKPDLAQEAAMERFRALMVPSSPPDKIAPRFAPLPAPDPNLQPVPLFNPAGRSFTPIQSGISRPTGIAPLPGITSPYALPTTPRSAGQAQMPPWLSDSPQPFSPPPQRQF